MPQIHKILRIIVWDPIIMEQAFEEQNEGNIHSLLNQIYIA